MLNLKPLPLALAQATARYAIFKLSRPGTEPGEIIMIQAQFRQ